MQKKERERTKAKIFAITGSAGKTSLKNLIKDLLQNYGNTLCSPKSYNNHFGVPLSLSQLKLNHEYGVFEIGMSKAGEIKSLSKFVKPEIGIITNIGEAHIENFKNLKGIAKAKGEIIDNIKKKNGTVILNRDDKFFDYLNKRAKSKNLNVVTFGLSKKSHYYPLSISKNKKSDNVTVKAKSKTIKLEIKNVNIYNILSSLALLNELNLNLSKAFKTYKSFEPSDGRGKIHKIKRYNKNFKLIDESYNANPLSVRSAINNFDSFKNKILRSIYYLGICLN